MSIFRIDPSDIELPAVDKIGCRGDFVRTERLIVVEHRDRREFRRLDGVLVGFSLRGTPLDKEQ